MPNGFSPRRAASSPDIITQAEAPSLSWLALPAVMNWSSPRTGLSLASPSSVVSGRLHSSEVSVTASWLTALVALSTTSLVVVIATISSAKRPACCAAAVRRWLSSAYSSCAARLMP